MIEKLTPIKYDDKLHVSFSDKSNALIQATYPQRPMDDDRLNENWKENTSTSWDWPDITCEEIKNAIFTSNPCKACGRDGINFQII